MASCDGVSSSGEAAVVDCCQISARFLFLRRFFFSMQWLVVQRSVCERVMARLGGIGLRTLCKPRRLVPRPRGRRAKNVCACARLSQSVSDRRGMACRSMVAEYAIVNGRTITVDVAFNPMPIPVYYMCLF